MVQTKWSELRIFINIDNWCKKWSKIYGNQNSMLLLTDNLSNSTVENSRKGLFTYYISANFGGSLLSSFVNIWPSLQIRSDGIFICFGPLLIFDGLAEQKWSNLFKCASFPTYLVLIGFGWIFPNTASITHLKWVTKVGLELLGKLKRQQTHERMNKNGKR